MSTIIAVGSMAYDSVETPFGKEDRVLGGSANYFSLSASYFARVNCVSVVGQDYPKEHLELLNSKGINTEGICHSPGETFFWAGRYGFDLHEAQTLSTKLNVFKGFNPQLPASYKSTPFVFLGNISPALQLQVLSQLSAPKLIAVDSMNFWIESERDQVVEVVKRCHVVVLNEAEVRQLTKQHNIVQAARALRAWGPRVLIVKRGEYGALLFDGTEIFSLPGLPLGEVKDPTGAGDSFAGGVIGYLASKGTDKPSHGDLRKAVVYGCVMASFTVQDFSFRELVSLSKAAIDKRYQQFVDLTNFHG